MQAFLIILIVVFAVILIGVNMYLLRLYSHPDDKPWNASPFSKVIIVLGLSICQAQALMVPLDVANRSAHISNSENYLKMGLFWLILYCALLALLCIFIPYAIFFYESDPQHTMVRRIARSIGYLFLTLIVSALLLFVTWPFLKFAKIPFTELIVDQVEVDNLDPIQS